MRRILLLVLCASAIALAGDPGKIFDEQISDVEREFVPLVEAMPSAQFSFAPTKGEFKGVRTFAQQATHVATTLYMISSAIMSERNPVETGENENGAASLKSKEQVDKYVKDAFQYAHRAMKSLNDGNLEGMVKSPFGSGETTRLSLAVTAVSHCYDHYGQMAVYLRMNGIIPPASR